MAVWDSADLPAQSPYSHPWLAKLLFAFDERLRRRLAVVEYTAHPSCVFRLGIARSRCELTLRDGTRLQAGQCMAQLHFWNEHIPPFPRDGTAIRWAHLIQQDIATSLRELARFLSSRPDLADISVICADVPCGTKSQTRQIARIMGHFGFEARDNLERAPIGQRIHRFGENILISLIVFAQNAGALRADTLSRVRVPIYISRRILEQKFGDMNAATVEAVEAP
jgi:hypothetical protein